MEKGDKYEIIRPLFKWKRIQQFSDIFSYISKSTIAEILGKEKSRFDELIQFPDELTFGNIDKLSTLFDLDLDDMALLIVRQLEQTRKNGRPPRDIRYDIIAPMFKEEKLKTFGDILKYIPKSVVAESIGKKPARFDQLMEKPGDFSVRDLLVIAELSEISPAEIFGLVKTQYTDQP